MQELPLPSQTMKLRCNEYFPEDNIDSIENLSMDVFRTGFARAVQVSIQRSWNDVKICTPRSVYTSDGYDDELYAENRILTLPEPNPEPNPTVVVERKRKSEEAATNRSRTDEVYDNGTLKMAKLTETRKRRQEAQHDEQLKRARENEDPVIAIGSFSMPQSAESQLVSRGEPTPPPTPGDFPELLMHRTMNQSEVGSRRKRALSKDDSEISSSKYIPAPKRFKTKLSLKRRRSRADPDAPEAKRREVDQMASWAVPDYPDMAAMMEEFCKRLASFSIE